MPGELNFFQKNARYIVLIAIFIGAFSGIFARIIDASPMAIGFYRMLFSIPFFAFPVLISSEKRQIMTHMTKMEWFLSLCAALSLYGHYMCWFKAVKLTNMATAATLESLHPLTVLVISLFLFKRRVGLKAVIGIFLAILGGVIVAMGGSGVGTLLADQSSLGNFLAFSSSVCLGLYFIFSKVVRDGGLRADVFIFVIFSMCGIMFAVTMAATGDHFTGYSRSDYLYMFAMALLCQIGAHALINWAFGYVSDLYVSTWQTFEGVVTIVLAYFFFAEAPTAVQIIGGFIAFGGLLYYNLNCAVDWEKPDPDQ